MTDDRGTGRTTAQMKAAPEGAVFIWCNSHLHYPRALAQDLGRRDLLIRSPEWLEGDGLRSFREEIVLDHAVSLTRRQYDGFAAWHFYMESRR
jgi:hypothetical protein